MKNILKYHDKMKFYLKFGKLKMKYYLSTYFDFILKEEGRFLRRRARYSIKNFIHFQNLYKCN